MSPNESARAINSVLAELPLNDRLSALACSIITDDPRALPAVANLISVAVNCSRMSVSPLRGTCSRRSKRSARSGIELDLAAYLSAVASQPVDLGEHTDEKIAGCILLG